MMITGSYATSFMRDDINTLAIHHSRTPPELELYERTHEATTLF